MDNLTEISNALCKHLVLGSAACLTWVEHFNEASTSSNSGLSTPPLAEAMTFVLFSFFFFSLLVSLTWLLSVRLWTHCLAGSYYTDSTWPRLAYLLTGRSFVTRCAVQHTAHRRKTNPLHSCLKWINYKTEIPRFMKAYWTVQGVPYGSV